MNCMYDAACGWRYTICIDGAKRQHRMIQNPKHAPVVSGGLQRLHSVRLASRVSRMQLLFLALKLNHLCVRRGGRLHHERQRRKDDATSHRRMRLWLQPRIYPWRLAMPPDFQFFSPRFPTSESHPSVHHPDPSVFHVGWAPAAVVPPQA